MSDTKTTTTLEQRWYAFKVAAGWNEELSKEIAPFDTTVLAFARQEVRTLLAPADVALEPLSEDEILDAVGFFRDANPDALDIAQRAASAQRAKLTRRPAESGAAPAATPVVERQACEHPQHLRTGSADTRGKITVDCGKCGERLVDVQMPEPIMPLLGTPSVKEKPPEAVPPEVTTDALDNALLGITANEYGSTHALSGREASAIRDGAEADILANLARQAEAHARERAADKARIEELEDELSVMEAGRAQDRRERDDDKLTATNWQTAYDKSCRERDEAIKRAEIAENISEANGQAARDLARAKSLMQHPDVRIEAPFGIGEELRKLLWLT